MQTVGEKLKNARTQKNLTLDEVYKQTKIHSRVLQALEEDRAHNFLSPMYIRSFMKAYAKYLNLDAEKLLKEYLQGQKAPTVVPEVVAEKKPKPRQPLRINKLLTLRIVAAGGLFLILIFYFRVVLTHVSSERAEVEIPKITIKTSPLPKKVEKGALSEKKAEQRKVERIEEQPVALPKAEKENLVLQVKAKENCWMRVNADEEVIFQKTLEKGRIEKWQANEKLELRIGKPEALELQLNGQPIDLEKEQVKRGLVITREGIVGN